MGQLSLRLELIGIHVVENAVVQLLGLGIVLHLAQQVEGTYHQLPRSHLGFKQAAQLTSPLHVVDVPGQRGDLLRGIVQNQSTRALHEVEPLVITEKFRGEVVENGVLGVEIHTHGVGIGVGTVEHSAPVVGGPAHRQTLRHGIGGGSREKQDVLSRLQGGLGLIVPVVAHHHIAGIGDIQILRIDPDIIGVGVVQAVHCHLYGQLFRLT